MAVGNHRPTKRVVNLQAIYNNITRERTQLLKETEIFAVVKANAYGHGAIPVAEIAREAGATGFCVAILDEALELRQAGITGPILILGVVEPQYLSLMIEHDLTATGPSLAWLKEVTKIWHGGKYDRPLKIHLKIDSGMGRLGLRGVKEVQMAVNLFQDNPSLFLEGIYTHFAKADSPDNSYFELQQTRFKEALAQFSEKPRYIHTANSATALWHNHWQSNLIRLGVSMYGLNPSGTELTTPYELEPALKLITEIVQIKKVPAGEHLSYGGDYVTTEEEWIGTLPLGYADGFIRSFTGFKVEVDGELVPIVGRVCMDQCMIRLKEEVPVGTKVTIYSNNKYAANSVDEAAEYIKTINYEVPCLISERVPIKYERDEK